MQNARPLGFTEAIMTKVVDSAKLEFSFSEVATDFLRPRSVKIYPAKAAKAAAHEILAAVLNPDRRKSGLN